MRITWFAVTRASLGIGRAIALGLAKKKAIPFLGARNIVALQEVAERARLSSPRVMVEAVDLLVDRVGMEVAQRLGREFDGLDGLVHYAGAYSSGTLEASSVEELEKLYRVNVRIPYRLTQDLLPLLKSRKWQIVFASSSQGGQARAGVGQFVATQHALKAIANMRSTLTGSRY